MALVIVYSAYVAEVYRAGIESVHPSQRMAARSLGLGYGQMMRHVILPQAIRRVIPPLLNDFIGLQKDTAIIGVVGVTEAVQQAQTLLDDVRELQRLHGRRRALRVHHDPAGALHRRPDPPARAAREGPGMSEPAFVQVDGVTKRFDREHGARRGQPERRRARGRVPDRRVRLGQVDAAALPQPAREGAGGDDRHRRPDDHRRQGRRQRAAPQDRHRLPGRSTSSRT